MGKFRRPTHSRRPPTKGGRKRRGEKRVEYKQREERPRERERSTLSRRGEIVTPDESTHPQGLQNSSTGPGALGVDACARAERSGCCWRLTRSHPRVWPGWARRSGVLRDPRPGCYISRLLGQRRFEKREGGGGAVDENQLLGLVQGRARQGSLGLASSNDGLLKSKPRSLTFPVPSLFLGICSRTDELPAPLCGIANE